MSDQGRNQSGNHSTPEDEFQGRKVLKHPYLLYGILNFVALLIMGLVGWWAWTRGIIPH